MKTKMVISFLNRYVAIVVALAIFSSCNRQFDEPPQHADPQIDVTMTIMQLKARYTAVGDFKRIQDDQIISGVVVADDRSGNFYKQIIIQDETGGIPVLLDANNVYTQYPVGRRVFIKLKGMMLGDYGGTIQVGLDSSRSTDGRFLNLDGIPQALFDNYIVKGSFNNVVTPKTIKPSDFTKNINDPLLSTLVVMERMEFRSADINKTYADPTQATSAINFTINNCNKESIVLRNSSYARFASLNVPDGNGTLIGVPSIFNGTMQMFIRDTADVQLIGERCGVMPATPITIADLRKLYNADMRLDGVYTVGGTVISDMASKNISVGSFVMQSGNHAIIVYQGGDIPYAVGDSVILRVGFADSLIKYRNSLELKLEKGYELPVAISKGRTVTPLVKTIAEINATLSLPLNDPNNFEYTLVRIVSATVTGGIFNGSKTVTDATGSVVAFTSSAASFANSWLPSNNPDWVAYSYNVNSTQQISIRNLADIIGGVFAPPSTGGAIDLGTTSPYLQNFNSIGGGLPMGVSVMTNARVDTVGRLALLTTAATIWSNVSGAFKNFASATGLTSSETADAQNTSANRALGLRQTGSFGDFTPAASGGGAAFVFALNNTIGKSNLKLDFVLQSVDGSVAGRTVTWTVDYGIGETPTIFTSITTTPTTLTTTLGTFTSTAVHADLPAAINNNASKIWIRIVALAASQAGGNGSRPSTAIDDFKISW